MSDPVIRQADAPFEAGGSRSVPRRHFLGGVGGLVAALAVPGCISRATRVMAEGGAGGALFAYVGCYSTPDRDGHGAGINLYRMDPASGRWSHVQLVASLENPSFLALDRRQRVLYSVHGGRTHATAFVIDPESGRLTRLNQQDVGGENPVHLAVDPTNRFLVVSNYGSGSMTVLPDQRRRLSRAPERSRRAGGHAGAASDPADELKPSSQSVRPPRALPGRAGLGSGPPLRVPARHGHGHFGAGRSTVRCYPAGRRPTPRGFSPESAVRLRHQRAGFHGGYLPLRCGPRGAEPATGVLHVTAWFHRAEHVRGDQCAPWGAFLYGSNRGHDSIVIFAVDQSSGLLTPVGWESTQGEQPRYFGLDPTGTLLYACNQGSDTVVTFRIDQETGELMPTGPVVETGSTVTIVFKEGGI
jgi:6-phosphogluconolactonase